MVSEDALEGCEVIEAQEDVLVQGADRMIFSTQQFIIFTLLKHRKGQAVPICAIIDVLTAVNPSERPSVSSVKVQIHRVRKKVEGHYRIKTIWRSGYKMEPICCSHQCA